MGGSHFVPNSGADDRLPILFIVGYGARGLKHVDGFVSQPSMRPVGVVTVGLRYGEKCVTRKQTKLAIPYSMMGGLRKSLYGKCSDSAGRWYMEYVSIM